MRRLLILLAIATSVSAQVKEKITVARVLVDVRVTDERFNPILGLKPADFRVRVDNKAAIVESVDWIEETGEATAPHQTSEPSTASMPATRPGRLYVFLFQTDFGRAVSRVTGEMKIVLHADDYLDLLQPEDRVAVLSYDSHLKFRLDFSTDRQQLRDAMYQSLMIDDPPRPHAGSPTLTHWLTGDGLKSANTIGDALVTLSYALRPIPGPKTMIFFSWGMGQYTPTGVFTDRNYDEARYALQEARVTVYSIDFTQADKHSLEGGLAMVSEHTGGFYYKTYNFEKQALDRLRKTLTGHYELEVRSDATAHGIHKISVETPGRKALVMSRTEYFEWSD